MARRYATADWLTSLHNAGRSDPEIAAALGRSTTFIQKVRTGVKPGTSLLPAAKRLATIQRKRTTGTARPLPNLAPQAPRRAQALRPKQKFQQTNNRFYVGKRPGSQLGDRIAQAARKGWRVRLTITWANVRYGTGHRSNKTYHDVPLTIWPGGEDAYEALGDMDGAGYTADPAGALANLTYDQDGIVQEVSGIEAWQLHAYEPVDEWG